LREKDEQEEEEKKGTSSTIFSNAASSVSVLLIQLEETNSGISYAEFKIYTCSNYR
jgi:metal-responsive CopG/Arc/MetJ family transcriptional regulator